MARETVSKRIAHVAPAGKRSGYPVYRLRDVAAAIVADSGAVASGVGDPTELPPRERWEWYNSELKRIQFQREVGQLIPADEVAQEVAATFKHIAVTLDTMMDVLERDAGLTPEQIQCGQRVIDNMRSRLYVEIADVDAEEVSRR